MAKYQVSCDLTFDRKTDQGEVFTYLNSKKDLAFAEKGDYLTLENSIDGTFRVACTYRLAKQADRDEIEMFLQSKKNDA